MCLKDSRVANLEFYKGKKIFLTGDTGFKGAWFSQVLEYLGANVLGYALPAQSQSLYERVYGDNHKNHLDADILDYDKLKKVIDEFQPEIVFHFAAFGFIKECFDNPLKAYNTNLIGTVNLLEALRNVATVKSIVLVSTDKVYFNKGDGTNYTEKDVLGGLSPYSGSKTCMEFAIKDYVDTFYKNKGIGVSVVRASNVLAGGDHIQSRLIPSILRAISAGETLEIRNPNQTRPWQSVLDALDGYLTVARYGYMKNCEEPCEWNIGPTEDGIRTVGWIVNTMKKAFHGLKDEIGEAYEVKESGTLGLDIQKMLHETDWFPKLSCEKVLEQVVDFYKSDCAGETPMNICKRQITEYYNYHL